MRSILEGPASLSRIQSETKTLHFDANINRWVLLVVVLVAIRISRVWSVVHGGHVVPHSGNNSHVFLTGSTSAICLVNIAARITTLVDGWKNPVPVLGKTAFVRILNVSKVVHLGP